MGCSGLITWEEDCSNNMGLSLRLISGFDWLRVMLTTIVDGSYLFSIDVTIKYI